MEDFNIPEHLNIPAFICSSCGSTNIATIPNKRIGFVWKCLSCGQQETECVTCVSFDKSNNLCLNKDTQKRFNKKRLHVSKRYFCDNFNGDINRTMKVNPEYLKLNTLLFRELTKEDFNGL